MRAGDKVIISDENTKYDGVTGIVVDPDDSMFSTLVIMDINYGIDEYRWFLNSSLKVIESASIIWRNI